MFFGKEDQTVTDNSVKLSTVDVAQTEYIL